MKPTLRNAELSDIDICWEIVKEARDYMIQIGRHQWTSTYPSRDIIENDIISNTAYLFENDHTPIGYVCIKEGEEPVYKDIKGAWLSNDQYIVIHRMVIKLEYRGKGLSKQFFDEIEQIASNRHISSIKIDTNYDNTEMLSLLKIIQFVECGIVQYEHGERIAFEKIIKKSII